MSRYHADLLAAYAPGTAKLRLTHLRAALRWARKQGLVTDVPDFPRVHVPQPRPRPLPAESYDRLLDTAGHDPQWVAFLALGWEAGLRVGEAAELRWDDDGRSPWVDATAGRIRFPVPASKSKREEWVPISAALQTALDGLPERRGRVLRLGARGQAVTEKRIRKLLAELCRRAGVRMTYRALRKSFGTRYASRVPAQVLQRLMRHAHVSTTLVYYCELSEAVEEAVKGAVVNQALNGTPANGREMQ